MKENMKGHPLYQRLLSFAMAAVLVFGILPVQTRAATESEDYLVDHTSTVADLDTVSRPADVYGTNTEHAGKITVGKSVSDEAITLTTGGKNYTFTPGTDNFIVTVSQAAQVMGLASESSVPVDVVFVLDTSNSMGNGRATSMVTAANAAIKSLMEANDKNRVGVVAFSGSSSHSSGAANQLSPLDHYDDVDANGDGDLNDTGDVNAASNHLRWGNSRGSVTSGGDYIIGRGTDAGVRDGIGGGTNIHAGVALGAKMLTEASTTALVDGKEVTRMPFLVILSDGAPTYSSSSDSWYDPSMTSEQGPGGSYYSGNGFLAALTAAYYKGKITEHYYGANASDNNRCYIYTIGVGLDSLTGDAKALAQITMDPATYTTGNYAADNAASYWNYGNTHDADTKDATHGWKTYWENYQKATAADFGVEIDDGQWVNVWVGEGEEGTGRPQREDYYDRWGRFDWDAYDDAVEAWEEENYERVYQEGLYTITKATIESTKKYVNGIGYTGGIAYNDDYFKADETNEIAAAFNKALQQIQLKSMASPTHVDATFGEDFSGYVTFTDPIGEYMEVKDMRGILANGKLYQGKSFAQHLQNWSTAPQEFKDLFIKVLTERCKLSGSTIDIEAFIAAAVASPNQAYYDETTGEYDNSIVWWGNGFTDVGEEDEQVQLLKFAEDDSVAYIEEQKQIPGAIPADADYVCRSYFFYGTAGDTAANPNHEYLHFVVRVQRSLKAPYQQTVVISAPASLLSVEKVMITETKDAAGNVTYSAAVTEAEPARVVYEVGLRGDINAFNVDRIMAQDAKAAVDAYDYAGEIAISGSNTVYPNYDAATGTYSFYTNDWDRSADEASHHRAMAMATFDAAADNSFYTYTEDTPIYVKDGDTYKLYAGTQKPVGEGYYYAREVYDWTGSTLTDGVYAATKKTVYVSITIPETDKVVASGDNWVVSKGVYKASSLVSANEDVMKRENKTGTATVVVHPHRTESETNSHYTVLLGNNGKLTLKSADTKTVDITKADNSTIIDADGKVVMVGDVLTYTMQVINGGDTDADATVTDTVPTGTAYVAGSADNGGEYNANTGVITWNIADIPAGEYVEVSFQVVVTEAALTGDLDVVSIDNTATVTLDNGFSYTTNTTKNPPEGKKVVDTNGNSVGTVDIPDVLVYRIRWYNDSGDTADVTVTDIIPAGTTYVAESASHSGVYDAEHKTITWTLKNEEAGASGVVSFRVHVNAAAGQTVENGAKIKVGNNNPRVTNKTTVNVAKGNLVLSKTVVAEGYPEAKKQEFTLNITEIGLGMNGTYTMLKNGLEVDDGITFTNGVATVTIKDGDTLEIQGITAGAIISVTEAVKRGFTPAYTTAAGNSTAEGRVTIPTGADATVAVTNTYAPAVATVQLQGTKNLQTELELDDTTFGFTAYPCSQSGQINAGAKPLTGEVTVSSDSKTANIVFAAATFSTTGTYYYLVSEIDGGVRGVSYAQNQYLLTVEVYDNGSGVLQTRTSLKQRADESSAFADASGVAFTNTYDPLDTQLTLEASKVLTGIDLKADTFSFLVTEQVNGQTVEVSYGTNDATGKICFRPITYDTVGEHIYTITEVKGSLPGVAYSTVSYTVKVNVENDDGQLVANVVSVGSETVTNETYSSKLVFTNTFTPTDVTLDLEGNKELDNKTGNADLNLKAEQFAFVVLDKDDKQVAFGNNDASGNIKFSPIVYSRAMLGDDHAETFTYTVKELIPDALGKNPNMHYDQTVYTVEVTVTYDSSTGLMTVSDPVIKNGNTTVTGIGFKNTLYPNTIHVTPEGFKYTYSDKAAQSTANVPQDATFSFVILDEQGNEVGVGVSTANPEKDAATGNDKPNISFSSLSFGNEDVGKTYTYTVKEARTSTTNGIEYDTAVYTMKVTITRNDGQLDADVKYYDATGAEATMAFVNGYEATGHWTVTASKLLNNGTNFYGKTFGFKLQQIDAAGDAVGQPVDGVSDSTGKITFGTLYYEDSIFPSGVNKLTLRYKMTEVAGSDTGVQYDTDTYYILTVELTHDHSAGKIDAKLTGIEDKQRNTLASLSDLVFNNTYRPVSGTSATIQLNKELSGRELRNGEFSFLLYHVTEDADGNIVETLVDSANNNVLAGEKHKGQAEFVRNYAATVTPGTYKYVIKEYDNKLGGVTYSTAKYWVLVTIKDNNQGSLVCEEPVYYSGVECTEEQKIDASKVIFANSYEAKATTVTPTAYKVLHNRPLGDREFVFTVKDGDETVSSGYNNADGSITFTPIGYAAVTPAGAPHVYTIQETAGHLTGVTYATTVYYLQVTVTDNGEGGLVAEAKYFSDAQCQNEITDLKNVKFENTFTPQGVSVQLKAKKVMNGHDMEQGEFSFIVRDETGKTVATGGNAAAAANQTAAITFSNIGFTFDMLGVDDSKAFIYSITEQPTTHGGVKIDENTYYAKVVLRHNKETGELTTSVTYHSDDSCTEENKLDGVPVFVNQYKPASTAVTLYADKTLINKELQEHEFTFTLKGEGVEQNKLTDANGRATFDALTFSAPGTYAYEISESVTDVTKIDRYTLDHSFMVIIKVEDNLRGQLVATVTYHEIKDDGTYDATVNLGGAEFINYYTAPALTVDLTAAIGATKAVETPDGITYNPEGFRFALTDTTGNLITGRDAAGNVVDMIGESGADGSITFPKFYFEKAGEYHYWITELQSDETGVTGDLRSWEIHILVRYNEETGLLYVGNSDVQTYPVGRAAESSKPAFVNVYHPLPIKLNLTATKILEGRELRDREFLFYLMEGETIVAQAHNDVEGNVTFELTYTEASIGNHSYTIKEMVPENGLGGVTYNGTAYATVTVKVAHQDDQHKLVASIGNTVLADGQTVATGITVTNQYSADGTSAKVYANKVLTGGKPLAAGEFAFTLVNTEDAEDTHTATNDISGKIEFALDFEKAGVYTYTMREKKGSASGVTYDDAAFTVTVTVEDDMHGQLHATVTYENNVIPTFVNEYKASYTTAKVEASKVLLGNKLLVADAYTFELERSDGVKVTTTNDAKGNVVFNLRYDEAGIYTYILREKAGDEVGTTYDATAFKVTVKVTDNLDGELKAEVSYDELIAGKIPTFVNTYQGKAVPVKITATKTLTGKALTADAYTFTLTNQDNKNDVLTVKNDAEGNVVFDLTFTEIGTYTYVLAETAGADANTTYDKTTYTVTIKVTDDLKGNLQAEVTGGTGLVFANVYTPSAVSVELEGEKKLSGRDMVKEEFSFEVRDSEGNVVAKAKNAVDGKLKFSAITLKAAGKYTFTVTEVKGSEKGMIYDTDKFTVTVEVTNVNGTLKADISYPKGGVVFENVYKQPDPTNPGTGDDTPLMLMVSMMLLSGGAIVALLADRKRRTYLA